MPKISSLARTHRAVVCAVCSPILSQTERPYTPLCHVHCLGSCTLLAVIDNIVTSGNKYGRLHR